MAKNKDGLAIIMDMSPGKSLGKGRELKDDMESEEDEEESEEMSEESLMYAQEIMDALTKSKDVDLLAEALKGFVRSCKY